MNGTTTLLRLAGGRSEPDNPTRLSGRWSGHLTLTKSPLTCPFAVRGRVGQVFRWVVTSQHETGRPMMAPTLDPKRVERQEG